MSTAEQAQEKAAAKSPREREIAADFTKFFNEVVAYDNTPGEAPPRSSWYKAANSMVETFAEGQMPRHLMPVTRVLEDFATQLVKHYETFGRSFAQVEQSLELRGTTATFLAVYKRYADPDPMPRVESVQDLAKLPNMMLEQIVRMTGLTLAQVIAERDAPGSICTEGFELPAVKHLKQERERDLEREIKQSSRGFVLGNCAATIAEMKRDRVFAE